MKCNTRLKGRTERDRSITRSKERLFLPSGRRDWFSE
jgi:hypothetical protein